MFKKSINMHEENFSTALLMLFIIFMSCESGKKSASDSEKIALHKEAQKDVKEVSQAEILYNQHCRSCHQTKGDGVPGMYPPLANSDWVEGDKTRIIESIIFGLEGPIEVNGETYNNAMPAMGYLTDEEVATILTYVRSNFGNDASAITIEEVAKVRASGK
ncbi:MAG TPA: cytochrome C [Cytophagales bacterium]|jgi:mono/diheme cytochrome c family protein|nr:cytochrome C [Cytophagales bacterium]